MSFFETPRFPDCISFGALGGPGYFTEVVPVASGHEQRNEVWQYARLMWDVSHGVRTDTDMHDLIAFFRSMRGKLHGFRFKDWSDFQSNAGGVGIIGSGGVGDGTPSQQLMKRYAPDVGVAFDLREIRKPVAGTIQVVRGGTPITTGFSIDTSTGLITFTASATATITAITKANPAVVTTSAAHGFANGQTIYISGISAGMTQVNNLAFVISAASGSTFTLTGINSTGYGTFTGTATASRYAQPSETLTWSGEFDVPCRFDTDLMKIGIVNKQGQRLLENWESIPVIELRQS